eukprot:scaffold1116_cov66-Phaeocystis_antarctica.AAC.1
MPISPVQGIGVRCIPQLVAPIDARVGGLHPRDERSHHLDSAGVGFRAKPPGQPICGCGIYIELADLHSTRSEKLRTVSRASKSFAPFLDKKRGLRWASFQISRPY